MTAQAVLTIWIPNKGFIRQGKICLIDGKPCFVANMTAQKWWRNYSGYAISKRILEKLPRGTKIIFKRIDLNVYYEANKTTFYKKGVLISYGSHSQIVLPIKNWKAHQGKLENEPKDLPIISLDKWLKKEEKPVYNDEIWGEAYA